MSRPQRIEVSEPSVIYASFGEFLADVIVAENDASGLTEATRRLNLHQQELERRTVPSGMSEQVPADGGFLLQPEWAEQILARSYQESAVLSRCTEWKLTKNGLKFPAIDETSRADGSRWGGTRGYWMNEADAMTATKPKLRQVELVTKKVGVVTYLTSELLSDMGSLAQYLVTVFGKELAFKVTDSAINGDGAGKPQGIVNSPALITVAKQGGQTNGTIVAQNVLDMLARFWVGSRDQKNAAWFVHSDAVSQLALLVVAVGSGGSLTFMLHYTDDGGSDSRMYLMGYPVFVIEQAQAVGTPGDILLADMTEYQLGWRDRGTLGTSMHVKFTTDEQTMRLIARVDGQGSWHTPVTPFNGTNTQSPFIALAQR